MPIFFFRNGAGQPLVTRPASWPLMNDRVTVAPDAFIEHLKSDQFSRQARLFLLRERRRCPRNGAFSILQIQASPASQGVVVSSISWP